MPDVEVKGENAHFFLLVQGSQDAAGGACRVRLLHADGQINGAATMATVSNLLRVKAPASGTLFCSQQGAHVIYLLYLLVCVCVRLRRQYSGAALAQAEIITIG